MSYRLKTKIYNSDVVAPDDDNEDINRIYIYKV